MSSTLPPSSTNLSQPKGAKAKPELSLLPLFLTPNPDTRGFQGWQFQMRAWGTKRINRKKLQSAGDGVGSRNFLASHREARRWHLGCAHKLPPTQRSQDGAAQPASPLLTGTVVVPPKARPRGAGAWEARGVQGYRCRGRAQREGPPNPRGRDRASPGLGRMGWGAGAGAQESCPPRTREGNFSRSPIVQT